MFKRSTKKISTTSNIQNNRVTNSNNREMANKNQEEADAKLARRLNQEEADAELARKLVEEEMINGQTAAFAPFMPPASRRNNATSTTTSSVANCPKYHGLTQFIVSHAQRVSCDKCLRRLNVDEDVYSCIICNYDICASCYRNPSQPRNPTPSQPRQTTPFPFPIPSYEPPTHMCLVPCTVGQGITVEMLVDTGAQSSVISYSLAQKLNLTNRLDRSHQGVAAGVGTARIIGKLRNVVCTMGHVEFAMDFIVLDVNDKQLLLLGLDQMRRFKCVVDLEREVLLFGGRDGVEVAFLPAEKSHLDVRNSLGQLGCPMM